MSNVRFSSTSNFPPIVKNLIIINVLVYIAQMLLDNQFDITGKIELHPILPQKLETLLINGHSITNEDLFKPWQIVSHFFAHSPQTIFHILFNMLVLFSFGRVMEQVWGSKRFLTFYLLCGLGAAALHLGMQYFRADQLLSAFLANDGAGVTKYSGALAPALGASGAIMGVMTAFAYTFPNTELQFMFLPVAVKAKWLVLAYVAIDLFGGFANQGSDNIAHFAHLGGAITGFIIVLIWNKTNKRTLY